MYNQQKKLDWHARPLWTRRNTRLIGLRACFASTDCLPGFEFQNFCLIVAKVMAEGDPVASVLQDLELLKQTNQQLENDYQNFNRAIAEAKRLQVSCTQNVAHQQDQLEQMRKKLG